jgi:hypothetical protein
MTVKHGYFPSWWSVFPKWSELLTQALLIVIVQCIANVYSFVIAHLLKISTILFSLTATGQLCLASLKAGRSIYIGSTAIF